MVNSRTLRIAIEPSGKTREAEERAIAKALTEAAAALSSDFPHVSEIVLYLPIKINLEHSAFNKFLGENGRARLKANESVKVSPGLSLILKTRRTVSKGPSPDAIVALLVDDRDLDEIDSCHGVSLIVAFPHSMSAFNSWVDRWAPKIIGKDGRQVDRPPVELDPEVENAFDAVSATTNLANLYLPDKVKGALESVFWRLKSSGYEFSPKDVLREFLKRGWNPTAAEKASKVATQILKRKTRPKNADIYYPNGW